MNTSENDKNSKSKIYISTKFKKNDSKDIKSITSSTPLYSSNTTTGILTPVKTNLFKSNDLKHYLNYTSGSKKIYESEKKIVSTFNSSLTTKEDKEFKKITSDTSINSINNISSNKDKIILILRILKFHKSSLDHQRYCCEKLFQSKSKNFCILDNYDKKKVLVSQHNIIF